jgi:sugar (pentulose or hexulose) kinase
MPLLGLDLGTTGCKAIVFDADGRLRARAFREYGVDCDAPAKAEQDAEHVWTLAKEALREVAAQAGEPPIRALSVSVQGDAIIPVDREFNALHPAILGMDYRSAAQARRCEEQFGGFELFLRTGMRPHPMNSLTKVLFLREHAPAVFARAWKIVTYADFILGKLGAEAVIDHTMASRTMAFDLGAKANGTAASTPGSTSTRGCGPDPCPRARSSAPCDRRSPGNSGSRLIWCSWPAAMTKPARRWVPGSSARDWAWCPRARPKCSRRP